MIIGITGKARSGKDTAADIIVKNFGFTKVALADKVRAGLLEMNPIIGRRRFRNLRLSEAVQRWGWEYVKDNFPESRRLLQAYGTEAGWKLHNDSELWIRAANLKTYRHRGIDVVVPDVRFAHEEPYCDVIIGISRHGDNGMGVAGKHISELGSALADHWISNNGTVIQLETKLNCVMRDHILRGRS